MTKAVYLSKAGLIKLEEEIEILKTVKRTEMAEKIKEARSFGDLSENSEYDEAMNEQAYVENRIQQLDAMIRNVIILDENQITTDIVSLGTTATVYDKEFKEEVKYKIVGSAEADPDEGRISDESPVGKALIGLKVGDTVSVQVPDGVVEYKVLGISI